LEHDIHLIDNFIQQAQPSNQEEATIMERVSCIFDNYYTYYQCSQYVKAWKCSTLIKLYLAKFKELLEITIQQHRAATRIQSIVRGFLQRKFEFDSLVQESAVIIQASLRGFLYRKQTHLKTQQDHLKDMNHLDDLIRNFTNDFNVITNEFRQLIESPRDDTQDHTIVKPKHGPDPVLPTQSGKQQWTTELKEDDDLHHGIFFLTFTRYLFDPGGKHFKINNAHDLQKKVVSFEQVEISNEGKFPLETTKTPTTAPTSLPSSTTPKIPSVFISFHAILALTLQFFTLTNKYKTNGYVYTISTRHFIKSQPWIR
jgi:hypothetical protein